MSLVDPSFDLHFATPTFPVRRFSVDEYHRMIETGVLTEDDRVELLEGWIVPNMVRRPRHDATIELIEAALRKCVPPGYRLRIQSAITTSDSEPEPDLALVQGKARDHIDRHPNPSEVALVIEVADTSLERDREKCRIYARAGVPQYWIVNLVDGQIEIYSEPKGQDGGFQYAKEEIVRRGEELDVEMLEGTAITVNTEQMLP